MSLKPPDQPCMILRCDECGARFDDEETGGTPHFHEEKEAREWAGECGWVFLADGRDLCGDCKCPCEPEECDTEGCDKHPEPAPPVAGEGQLTMDGAA